MDLKILFARRNQRTLLDYQQLRSYYFVDFSSDKCCLNYQLCNNNINNNNPENVTEETFGCRLRESLLCFHTNRSIRYLKICKTHDSSFVCVHFRARMQTCAYDTDNWMMKMVASLARNYF